MPVFTYLARNINGQDFKGEIESSDPHGAVVILRRRGLIVISVKLKTAPALGFISRFFNRISLNDIVIFTRQLATMVQAGLVLSESMDILAEQQSNKRFREALDEISDDLKGGLSLEASLARHPDIFPSLYIHLVKAGEESGKLDAVLAKMAESLEKEREFRSKIRGAMIYPIMVLGMMIFVIILMMTFVIPKLTTFYTQSSLELPLPTKILIGVSNTFVNFWWALAILFAAALAGAIHFKNSPTGKLTIDRMILKIPQIGRLTSLVILTNFNRTFGLLTAAGIPLLDSINIVSDVTENSVYKEGLKDAYKGVESGLTFSRQLLVLPHFPRLIGQMVRVGEETGKLDEIFNKLADYFETESDQMVKNLTVIIEPVVLVVLGLGVAFLVIAIILPIYKLTTSF